MYFSVALQECRVCPENSMSSMAGVSECPCVEGYYRVPGEDDLPCTGKNHNLGSRNLEFLFVLDT